MNQSSTCTSGKGNEWDPLNQIALAAEKCYLFPLLKGEKRTPSLLDIPLELLEKVAAHAGIESTIRLSQTSSAVRKLLHWSIFKKSSFTRELSDSLCSRAVVSLTHHFIRPKTRIGISLQDKKIWIHQLCGTRIRPMACFSMSSSGKIDGIILDNGSLLKSEHYMFEHPIHPHMQCLTFTFRPFCDWRVMQLEFHFSHSPLQTCRTMACDNQGAITLGTLGSCSSISSLSSSFDESDNENDDVLLFIPKRDIQFNGMPLQPKLERLLQLIDSTMD
jgi:hypothetical protein